METYKNTQYAKIENYEFSVVKIGDMKPCQTEGVYEVEMRLYRGYVHNCGSEAPNITTYNASGLYTKTILDDCLKGYHQIDEKSLSEIETMYKDFRKNMDKTAQGIKKLIKQGKIKQ